MSRSDDEFVIVNIGDVHNGHPSTPTPHILGNLYAAIPDNAQTAKVHLILFTGDFFDRMLQLAYEYNLEIQLFVKYLLKICKKHDILLRVLEGTPRHDNKQSEMFDNLNNLAEIGADLKYVKTLSIEYIERYGISVLYVPDEANHETETTLSQVHELLRAKGLTHVDYAAMHGQFGFQLPEHVTAQKHDAEAYLAIVKELILIGHHHTHARYKRIIAPGSFDRLRQNEEEAKGHIRARIRNGEHHIEFIENVNAKKYVTVDCTGLDMEELIKKIDLAAAKLPAQSNIRVRAESTHPIFTSMEILIKRYPSLNWAKKAVEKEREAAGEVEDEEVYKPPAITQDNLSGLLISRVASRNPSAAVLAAARVILEEVI